MDGQQTAQLDEVEAVPEWNPLAELVDEIVPLEVSGGRATIVLRRWSGRERLAYEDAITQKMLTTDERTGEDTVKIGTLRMYAATLTIRGSSGFPVEGFLSGPREKVEADLLSITDRETFSEILRHALRVQPLPSQESAAGDDGDDDEDGDDPFPTPRTPEANGDAAVSESHAG